ncbi:MAG: hypothetical protein HND47_06990 [Chloroflexi bacterium]|nr:hypothetical protein [Chloroflexota bacterium]
MTRSTFVLILLIVVSAALAVLRFDSLQIGASYDDAHYIILAESLASGQGYQLINFPRPQIERNFPPGWSLLLAPFTLVFPKNYDALKVVSLVLWLASIPLVYQLFSKRLPSPALEILTGLVALNPLLVGASVTVMSESAYLFFSLLALLAFEKSNGRGIGWIVSAALLAFYAQQIRTIGIALGASLLTVLLLTRRFRELGTAAVILMVGILLQAGINLRNGGTVISSGYEAQVLSGSAVEKFGQVWSNASGYFDKVLAGSLIPVFGARLDAFLSGFGLGWLTAALNVVILLVIAFGLFAWKPKLEWMHIYFLIYALGMLAFWNPKVGSVKARFLIPLLPMLYFYFLVGIRRLMDVIARASPRFAERSFLGVSGLIALALLARHIQDWRSPVREQMTDLSIGASWVAEHAPADAIVMVNEPVPAYVHVKRRTIGFPKNDQDLLTYLDNQGIDYIIVAPPLQSPPGTELEKKVEEQILPILESMPERFVVVYESPQQNVTVYRVDP